MSTLYAQSIVTNDKKSISNNSNNLHSSRDWLRKHFNIIYIPYNVHTITNLMKILIVLQTVRIFDLFFGHTLMT